MFAKRMRRRRRVTPWFGLTRCSAIENARETSSSAGLVFADPLPMTDGPAGAAEEDGALDVLAASHGGPGRGAAVCRRWRGEPTRSAGAVTPRTIRCGLGGDVSPSVGSTASARSRRAGALSRGWRRERWRPWCTTLSTRVVAVPERARWHLQFIPTRSSWLNLVERWFKELAGRRLRHGTFTSVPHLVEAIETWVEHWNHDPKPIMWHKTADEIIARCGEDVLHLPESNPRRMTSDGRNCSGSPKRASSDHDGEP